VRRRAAPRAPGVGRVLRIVGGSWRSRRFRFPPGVDIRPTPDRVRETLFNWLAAQLPAARCLDLFAGSGALGLEALSRGAREVCFVEHDRAAAGAIRALLAEWHASTAQVFAMDALRFLQRPGEPFDIVFLDPPFASAALARALPLLESGGWLAPRAWIYVECAARTPLPALPAHWQGLKSGRAGEVGYHLLERRQGGAEP
jgi:16S rRNA (guanine966-N2)-methyltransferase